MNGEQKRLKEGSKNGRAAGKSTITSRARKNAN